jgi:hypothetical protein
MPATAPSAAPEEAPRMSGETRGSGGLLAVACVYGLGAALSGRDPVLVLVLAGIVIGSLLGAGVGARPRRRGASR